MNTKAIGDSGEKIAKELLKKKGYKILDNNFRCDRGEIDLIVQKGKTIVFVEVKTRKDDSFSSAIESVNYHKQQRIIFTAKYYITTNKLKDFQYRFDVIEVYNDQINHFENAFTL